MFCSQCGCRAEGKFCCQCGAPLSVAAPPSEPAHVDWEQSLDYEVVRAAPDVRAAIARAEAKSRQGVSGAQYLQLVDGVAATFTGGVSSVAIGKIVQPLCAKLGMTTSKQRAERLPIPPGRALADVLVALAGKGRPIAGVVQEPDFCELTAVLSADLRSLDGTLLVTVRRDLAGSLVAAEARIDGQWYDWGKCRRGLDDLFDDMRRAA